tara:strand:- start:743 stop:1507 length:765 start_codon:yes stop_codon:yes gene_type:complete
MTDNQFQRNAVVFGNNICAVTRKGDVCAMDVQMMMPGYAIEGKKKQDALIELEKEKSESILEASSSEGGDSSGGEKANKSKTRKRERARSLLHGMTAKEKEDHAEVEDTEEKEVRQEQVAIESELKMAEITEAVADWATGGSLSERTAESSSRTGQSSCGGTDGESSAKPQGQPSLGRSERRGSVVEERKRRRSTSTLPAVDRLHMADAFHEWATGNSKLTEVCTKSGFAMQCCTAPIACCGTEILFLEINCLF